jgi:hypothetical protein
MRLIFSYGSGKLSVLDDAGTTVKQIAAFSAVRNEQNGERPDSSQLPDVEHSENADGSGGPPVMPRPFPLGEWTVSGFVKTAEKWLQPIKLITDAHQTLDVWALKDDGEYDEPNGETVEDYGYRIHFANGSHHTDGCIGLSLQADIEWLAANVAFPVKISVAE